MQDDIAVLISGLRDPEKEIRAERTRMVVGHGNAAVPYLIPLLKDHDWKVRYRAAEALGMIGSDDAVHDLISTCQDEKDHVRYMAAKSLGRLKNPVSVPVLIMLLDDDHPYTRGIASEGLAAINDPRGIDPLADAIRNEKIPALREKMVQNLSLLKTPMVPTLGPKRDR